jgi:L-lactate dehydrogenase complex protein LldG
VAAPSARAAPKSEARDQVLANIRRSLRRAGALDDGVRAGLQARLDTPRANLKPHYDADPVEHFERRLRAVSGIVTRVRGAVDISGVVEEHVRKHALAPDLVVAPDPDLDDIAWSNRFKVERRAAVGSDQTSVTSAFAGVGETGSLVLLSSPRSPTTLNFLPEDHLIVLARSRIVPHIEDVWTRLRTEIGAMPRTVNFITGPSKTGDVEQVIQEGAHGPRRLHVILREDR